MTNVALFQKCIRVVKSCKTRSQLAVASQYLWLAMGIDTENNYRMTRYPYEYQSYLAKLYYTKREYLRREAHGA